MADNPHQKDLRVYLDADIHMRLKILCVKKNRSMSSVVAELVEQWIEETEELERLERQKRPPRN